MLLLRHRNACPGGVSDPGNGLFHDRRPFLRSIRRRRSDFGRLGLAEMRQNCAWVNVAPHVRSTQVPAATSRDSRCRLTLHSVVAGRIVERRLIFGRSSRTSRASGWILGIRQRSSISRLAPVERLAHATEFVAGAEHSHASCSSAELPLYRRRAEIHQCSISYAAGSLRYRTRDMRTMEILATVASSAPSRDLFQPIGARPTSHSVSSGKAVPTFAALLLQPPVMPTYLLRYTHYRSSSREKRRSRALRACCKARHSASL